jgi:hypothetical protein
MEGDPAMRLMLAFLMLLTVTPNLARCPIDKGLASSTGKTRMENGQTSCEYSHIWIHGDSDKMYDEKHVFWAACTAKEK